MSIERRLAMCLLVGEIAACESPRTARPLPPAPDRHAAEPAAAASPSVAPPPSAGQGARVVVDISASMKGFVVRDPGTGKFAATLETIHGAIDQTLSELGHSSPLERCVLGDSLDCTRKLRYSDYREPKTYGEKTSHLDKALLRPIKPPEANPASPPPADNLDPFHLFVLVTDGAEATESATGNALPPANVAMPQACVGGADPACVGALLGARVREGYGLWLVAAMLPFQGKHYAERGLDSNHHQRIVAHLKYLKEKRPEWVDEKLVVSSLSTERLTGNSYFEYTGAKPLLMFILSRDLAAGRAFVANLTRRLENERVGRPAALGIRSMEIAPYGDSRSQIASVARVGKDEAADRVLLDPSRRAGAVVHQPVRCQTGGHARVAIRIRRSAANPPLPQDIVEQVSLRPGKHPLDARIVAPPKEDADGFTSAINCTWLQAGRSTSEFELVVKRQLANSYPTNSWWVDFSTDNTYEMPERVYGLRDLITSVQKSEFTSETVVDTLALEIERR